MLRGGETGVREGRGRRSTAAAMMMVLAGALVATCGPAPSVGRRPAVSSTRPLVRPTTGAPAPTVASPRDSAGTVWLCAPGLGHDPCAADRDPPSSGNPRPRPVQDRGQEEETVTGTPPRAADR
ncbi:MAG TPA: hypothetical protein VNC61_04145 [Acidimicrobiales bacterium]|nr:hypothetical protein [Acidimicrobiales bacterium]